MLSHQPETWSPEWIIANPQEAMAWARKQRKIYAEAADRNASMDSGWSASEAQRCEKEIARCNYVELTVLRSLIKKAVDKMNSGTNAWSEFQGWCPEFEALKSV